MRIRKDKQNTNQTAGINPNRLVIALIVNMLKALIFKSNIIRQASCSTYFVSQDIGKPTHNSEYTKTEFVAVHQHQQKKTERQNLSAERDRDLCQYMTY